jgi:hypothetical protein
VEFDCEGTRTVQAKGNQSMSERWTCVKCGSEWEPEWSHCPLCASGEKKARKITPLEFNGVRATFSAIQDEIGSVFSNGIFVPRGSKLSLCAWCSKDLTEPLDKAGYVVSHTICSDCQTKLKAENDKN